MDPTICDSGTAENGTKTGVSVQFDTWQGKTIVDQNGTATAGNDNVGWRVHFDGKMVERINVTQVPHSPDGNPGNNLNGLDVCPPLNAPTDFSQDPSCTGLVCADNNTIQTGIYSAASSGDVSNLCWVHFSIELTTNTPHLLTVKFKSRTLVDHLAMTNFFPYVGQLVMGGRTGNANENRDVDNVHIVTYPAVQAIFNGITSSSAFLTDFTLLLQNIGPAKVTTVNALILDGTDVTHGAGTTITIADPTSTIKYVQSTPFPAGSAHSVAITFTDAGGTTQTQTVGFTTLPYFYMPGSAAIPDASIDTTQPGFRVVSYQVGSGEPNRMYWADEELEGVHGTNWIDYAAAGVPLVDGNQIQHNDLIDFGNSAGPSGQFPDDRGWGLLGIPSLSLPNDNNSAAAFMAYLHFPTPGTYVMGFNSDDYARVTYSRNPHDLLGNHLPGLNADSHGGGRGIGPNQNVGAIIVTNAGYYGFRLLYENGGGGSAVEWYFKSTPAGVTNVLIQDVLNNAANTIYAWQFSSNEPPYVSYAEPPLDDDQVTADTTLQYKLSDASTTVNSGSVVLKLNGTTQSPTVTSAAGVTSISLPPPASLWPPGTNTVELSFKDSANANYDYNYIFVVLPYTVLDTSVMTPLGSQDATKPGFMLHVSIVDPGLAHAIDPAVPDDAGDGVENDMDCANAIVEGLFFPWYGTNAADVANAAGTNVSALSSNMWYVNDPVNYVLGGYSGGIWTTAKQLPGVPLHDGLTTQRTPYGGVGAWFDGYVAFPKAGLYNFVVFSDDGFRLTEGIGVSRNVLHVSGASVSRDVAAVPTQQAYVGGNWHNTLPDPPITAPIVYIGTNQCPGPITNNLSGSIALIDGNWCKPNGSDGGYDTLVAMCQAQGAVACIVQASPAWGLPERIGGGTAIITIPVVHISGYNGEYDWFHTNGPLTATIGRDTHPIVNEANYGKGTSEISGAALVPQAGVYPMHLTYEGGPNGGNAVAWYVKAPDGSINIINDASNTNSLLAYRAVTVTNAPPPTLHFGKQGNSWVLTYTGTLYSSSTVNGTYTPVAGAVSPYTVPANTTIQFYRAHQ